MALGAGSAVAADDGELAPGEARGQLAGVRDRRRGRDDLGTAPVVGRDALEAAEHLRHVASEDAAVGVELVDDDEAQRAEQRLPGAVARQDAGVEHVGRRDQHGGGSLAQAPALGARRVAVVDRHHRRAVLPEPERLRGGAQPLLLVLLQGAQGEQEEGMGAGLGEGLSAGPGPGRRGSCRSRCPSRARRRAPPRGDRGRAPGGRTDGCRERRASRAQRAPRPATRESANSAARDGSRAWWATSRWRSRSPRISRSSFSMPDNGAPRDAPAHASRRPVGRRDDSTRKGGPAEAGGPGGASAYPSRALGALSP